MNRFIKMALVLSALTMTIHLSYARKKAPKVTAIAFYNTENLFDTTDDPQKYDDDFTPAGSHHYNHAVYQQKLHNIAIVLSRLALDEVPEGPVLTGLAEIENEQVLKDLLAQAELKGRNWKFLHFDSPDRRGIDVALLYDPARFRVLHARALPVEIMESGRRDHTRDILYVTGILGSDTVHVFVNHWPSRRGGEKSTAWKRAEAAAVCRKHIDSVMKQDRTAGAILMGDLNDDPVDASVVQVIGATGDSAKVQRRGIYNPWMHLYKEGIGSLCYRGKWNLFDQIMLSYSYLHADKGHWKFYKAQVFSPSFLKNASGRYKNYPFRSFSGTRWANGYSDHFPTIVYLKRW